MFATGTLTRKYTIHLAPDDDLNNIKSKLLAKLVEFEAGKQNHMIAVKEKFNQLLLPDQRIKKRTSRLKNLVRKYDFKLNGEKVNSKIGFSYRKFSELTGLSIQNCFYSLKHAETIRIINLNVPEPLALRFKGNLYKMNKHEFEMAQDVISEQMGGYSYLSRYNEVLAQGSTEIDFIQYPLKAS